MATSSVTVDSTSYTLLSTTDSLIQNTSAYVVRVSFDTTPPASNITEYHLLAPYQAIQKSNGLPADNAYGMCDKSGNTAKIAISG